MTALILTGPRDGELIDCNRPFLEMEAPPTPEEAILAFAHLTACTEPLSRKKLTFSFVENVDDIWPIVFPQRTVARSRRAPARKRLAVANQRKAAKSESASF